MYCRLRVFFAPRIRVQDQGTAGVTRGADIPFMNVLTDARTTWTLKVRV